VAVVAAGGLRQRGRGTKAAAAGVEFLYLFFTKTELARGRGVRQEAKYPTGKAHIRRKLVLLHWENKFAQTPKYTLVQKSPRGNLA
jgi:hypothetical protein